MGKTLIIFVLVIAAIIAVVLINVEERSEAIPEMLNKNIKDIGSYALQYAVNQVKTDKINETTTVEYSGDSTFTVLEGSINSLSYIFTKVQEEETEGGYALYCGSDLVINGGNIQLTDGHTEGDLTVNGNNINASGTITYCGNSTVNGNGTNVDTEHTSSQPAPSLPLTLEELKSMAMAAGTYFNGTDVKLKNKSGNRIRVEGPDVNIPNGSVIYVNNGKIEINQDGFDRTVTLISTGDNEVKVNGNNITLTPAVSDILIYCEGKVDINGNGFTISGIVQADGDELKINGNDQSVFKGSLWADEKLTINGNGFLISEDNDDGGSQGDEGSSLITQVEIISNVSLKVQGETLTHQGNALLKLPEDDDELKIVYWKP